MEPIPSVIADAARVSVSPHTVHIELAMSTHDGTFQPVLRLSLSREVASELAALLEESIRQARRLGEATAT